MPAPFVPCIGFASAPVGQGPPVSDAERELEGSDEHRVTPLELFFDLVFVFAITQVTSMHCSFSRRSGGSTSTWPRSSKGRG